MIRFQIRHRVPPERIPEFVEVVRRVFAPAVSKQEGFQSCTLLQEYPDTELKELGATSDGHHLQIELTFESEELRQKWVATSEHAEVLAATSALSEATVYSGYLVVLDEASRVGHQAR
jgi:heme-degrading monooxygenase HmoA